MRVAGSLNFNNFLIMPPAYYKYGDAEVIDFYSRLIEALPNCKIILYNFEKLCGYKFSIPCVEKLVKKFPKQVVGVKDSSYNLYEDLKIDNFAIFPGSELKLLKGLELGCSGIITATCNVTAYLARNVYDDFIGKKIQSKNIKLCEVRKVFDQYNLISALHTFLTEKDSSFNNILPPLRILRKEEKIKFNNDLKDLNFELGPLKSA